MNPSKPFVAYALCLFVLLFSKSIFADGDNTLLVSLQKRPSLGQVYYHNTAFPKNWIQQKWSESYAIKYANYQNSQWFVVMEKEKTRQKQTYAFNPSDNFLNQHLRDGYTIQDLSLVSDNKGHFQRFYVFTKTSTQAIDEIAYSGRFEDMDSWYTKELSDRIKNKWKDGYACKKARVYCVYQKCGGAFFVLDMIKGAKDQILAYSEVPQDFIYNKKAEGFFLIALTYDEDNKQYLIVMQKENVNWKLLNLKNAQNKQEFDKLYNHGYYISGVY